MGISVKKKKKSAPRKEHYIYGRIIYDRINDNEKMKKLVVLFDKGENKKKRRIILNKDARVKRSSIEFDTEYLSRPKIKKEIKKIVKTLKKIGATDIHVHIVSDAPKNGDITYYRLKRGKVVSHNDKKRVWSLRILLIIIAIISIITIIAYLIYLYALPEDFIIQGIPKLTEIKEFIELKNLSIPFIE